MIDYTGWQFHNEYVINSVCWCTRLYMVRRCDCDPGTGRRLWPGCSGHAAVCQMSSPVRRTAGRCSSLASKRRCCTRLSGRRRRSEGCARGAGHECGSCRLSQRFSRSSRTASWSRWSRQAAKRFELQLRCDQLYYKIVDCDLKEALRIDLLVMTTIAS